MCGRNEAFRVVSSVVSSHLGPRGGFVYGRNEAFRVVSSVVSSHLGPRNGFVCGRNEAFRVVSSHLGARDGFEHVPNLDERTVS